MNINECKIINLLKIENRAGNISPIHGMLDIPFNIKRIFYLYDIPGGKDRGAHAHKKCHQFLIAGSGSFDVFLDDGKEKKTIKLNRPNYGLYIPPMIWAAEKNFSSGSICLVLTSERFNEDDYLRNYDQYLSYIN
tara:strand:- start:7736 stop:8140 length:405 start_codon:yes stop_codon:yes gene_type:complete